MLVLIPLLGCLYFSLTQVIADFQKRQVLNDISELSQLAILNNAMVHELQKERGMSAVYIGSNGQRFKTELSQQHALTDTQKNKVSQFISHLDSTTDEANTLIKQIQAKLAELDSIRQQILALTISKPDALNYYTTTNHSVLLFTNYFISISPKETVNIATAYYNFLEAKERAGIERAVASGGLANNRFSSDNFEKLISLITAQNIYTQQFLLSASQPTQQQYQSMLNDNAVKEVMRIRKLIINIGASGPYETEAAYWFDMATKRINLLKNNENYIAEHFANEIDTLLSNMNTQLLVNLATVIIVILITAFVAYTILTVMLKQLDSLVLTLKKVAKEHDLTARSEIYTRDELGNMAMALNNTLESFAGAIDQISNNSVKLSESANETATTIQLNTVSIQSQQDETAQVATAIEQMSATVEEVARSASQALQTAQNANNKAINSQTVVGESLTAIDNLVQQVNEIGSRISTLHETSNQIVTVIDVIKSVAEQTNLLALNAAIEAARAGEQGRGFAVVADEVRTLAQRTQTSTVEIETIINQLQQEADNAYKEIDSSQENVKKTVESAEKIEFSLTEIVTGISDINAMIEQIATATEEQVSVTTEINKNISDIDSATKQIAQGSEQVSNSANNQASLANNLQQLATTYRI